MHEFTFFLLSFTVLYPSILVYYLFYCFCNVMLNDAFIHDELTKLFQTIFFTIICMKSFDFLVSPPYIQRFVLDKSDDHLSFSLENVKYFVKSPQQRSATACT